jgi:hypothetical protein
LRWPRGKRERTGSSAEDHESDAPQVAEVARAEVLGQACALDDMSCPTRAASAVPNPAVPTDQDVESFITVGDAIAFIKGKVG